MADISFHLEKVALPDGSNCISAKFTGSVDTTSSVDFENVFKKLIEEDSVTQLIVNLSGLTYISSTGLGVLIRYVQKCREKGGDIKITNVPTGIWTVFRTVGVDHIFEILTTEQQALRNFQEQAGYKSITKHRYPARFKCPNCTGSLELNQPGKYRCPYCATLFAADESGSVKGFIPRKPKVIESKIFDESDSVEWIKGLVHFQAKWLKFADEDITKLEQAVDKTYQLLTTKIAKIGKSNYRLVLVTDKKEFSIGFIILGEILLGKDAIKENTDYQSIHELVDRIDAFPLTPQGLIVKLTKALKK